MYLRHIHDLNMGLGVDNLCGCSDRVLNGISQSAQLDAWKARQRLSGELSVVELYKSGSRILMQLWEGAGMVEGLAAIVAETFRCAAVIYVNVVMSGITHIGKLIYRSISRCQRNQKGNAVSGSMHHTSLTAYRCVEIGLLADR
jgi:hypothetical protein